MEDDHAADGSEWSGFSNSNHELQRLGGIYPCEDSRNESRFHALVGRPDLDEGRSLGFWTPRCSHCACNLAACPTFYSLPGENRTGNLAGSGKRMRRTNDFGASRSIPETREQSSTVSVEIKRKVVMP